jgi:hypothetical protein
MRGTFVPFFGLNNMFGQIPVFGLFLGVVSFVVEGMGSLDVGVRLDLEGIAVGRGQEHVEAAAGRVIGREGDRQQPALAVGSAARKPAIVIVALLVLVAERWGLHVALTRFRELEAAALVDVASTIILITLALITGVLFLGLTVVAFTTRTDFSFLRGVLVIGGFVALGLIVASILFGFTLGLIFSVAMVGFASAAILYYTSNVLRYYRTDQYVAASVTLFASVALLFFYVLQILISLRSGE